MESGLLPVRAKPFIGKPRPFMNVRRSSFSFSSSLSLSKLLRQSSTKASLMVYATSWRPILSATVAASSMQASITAAVLVTP